MADNWKDYQEEAADFFRSIGLDASTDLRVQGVRTHHDVDVVVTSHHAGFDITWFVECKHWSKPVSKLHVLGLREIVADCGVDRGIILCESGFQSGAAEAAKLTNVRVTSLKELSKEASHEIFAMRLREQYDRIEVCKEKYWDIPKDVRIEHGLRPDLGDAQCEYSGKRAMEVCADLITQALRGRYPIRKDTFAGMVDQAVPEELHSIEAVVTTIEPMLSELESRLKAVA
jgi:hypothetical protein